MDPLTRKLFQPREAREKLRGMGGIMSSSSQLANTVAKFNVGGPIQAMAPQRSDLGGAMPLASAVHGPSGMMYGQMSLQQLSELAKNGDRLAAEILMMLQPPTGGTLPDETRARLDLVRGITDPDSSFGRQLDQFSTRLADFGTQPRVAADVTEMDMPSIGDVPAMAVPQIDQAPARIAQPGLLSLPTLGDAGPSVAQSRLSPTRMMMTDNALDPRLDMFPGSALFQQQQQEVDDFNSRQRERDRVAQAPLSNDPDDPTNVFLGDPDAAARAKILEDAGIKFSEAPPGVDIIPPGGFGRGVAGFVEQGLENRDNRLATQPLDDGNGAAQLTSQYRQIMDELSNPEISENRRKALTVQLDTISLALKAARADASITSAAGRVGEFVIDAFGNVVSVFDVDAGEGVFGLGDSLRESTTITPEQATTNVEQAALESARDAAALRAAQGTTTSLRTAEDVAAAAEEAGQTVTRTTVAGVEPPVTAEETPETPVADVEPPVAETAAPTIDVDLNDPSTYDTDFEEMMRRLGGATGKDDKSSRQKAMADLAMIGLAIAAGQSPDALTNIAQGALTGMKAIRAEDAAKDAVASETRALAAKLATDREIARIRVPSGGGTYTPERLYQQNLNAILANPDLFDVLTEGGVVDSLKARRLATELSQRGDVAASDLTDEDREMLGLT